MNLITKKKKKNDRQGRFFTDLRSYKAHFGGLIHLLPHFLYFSQRYWDHLYCPIVLLPAMPQSKALPTLFKPITLFLIFFFLFCHHGLVKLVWLKILQCFGYFHFTRVFLEKWKYNLSCYRLKIFIEGQFCTYFPLFIEAHEMLEISLTQSHSPAKLLVMLLDL